MSTLKTIVLASGNAGKLREFNDLLSDLNFDVKPQSEYQVPDAIEDGLTFVENAIIHGFSTKKTKSLIEIKITKSIETLTVEIIDNGIGRQQAKNNNSENFGNDSHQSIGQKITFERIKAFTDKNKGTFSYDIIDLYNQNGQSLGTKIILNMTHEHLFP